MMLPMGNNCKCPPMKNVCHLSRRTAPYTLGSLPRGDAGA